MKRLIVPRYQYPTAFDETLSYYEQLVNLQNYIDEVAKQIETVVSEVETYVTSELEKFSLEVKAEVEKANAYTDTIKYELEKAIAVGDTNSMVFATNEIKKESLIINQKIDEINVEINSRITSELAKVYAYIDTKLIDVKVINGFTGQIDSIQNVLDDIIAMFRTGSITAIEYDSLNLTALAYDNYGLTAREYDFDAKNLLG